MRYLHAVVKAKKGDTIHVTFSQPTRVLLLTPKQYKNYKAPKTFTYTGGHMEGDSCEFEVDKNGEYHVVVELGSYFNPMQIEASTTVIPKSYTSIDGENIPDSDSTGQMGDDEGFMDDNAEEATSESSDEEATASAEEAWGPDEDPSTWASGSDKE